MIDLDKEKMIITKETLSSYSVGWNDGIDNLKLKYNIITVPKTIKLSEIVDRLNKTLKEHSLDSYIDVLIKRHKIEKDKNKSYVTVFHAGKSYQNQGENYLFSFWNNESISKPEHTCFKWLYALWIAGTIIEDDLREE